MELEGHAARVIHIVYMI